MPFGVNPTTGRPGPSPKPPVDGDRKQARQRINVEVRTGRRPHPNALPCADCGHVWSHGDRRHEYDHHKGYAAEHHYDVEAVCTTCHAQRSYRRGEVPKYRNATADVSPLLSLYASHTLAEVAAIAGVPEETVRRRLKQEGVTLRKRGEKPRG